MHIFCTFFIRRSVQAPITAKKRDKTDEIQRRAERAALNSLEKIKKKSRETVSLEITKPAAAPTKTKARGCPAVTESKKQKQVTAQKREYNISETKTETVPNLISARSALKAS